MTHELDRSSLPTATIRPRHRSGWAWFMPLAAAGVAGWLIVGAWMQRGIDIEVSFSAGEGLVPQKTFIKHRGVVLGQVSAVRIPDNADGIIAVITMHADAQRFAVEGTQFWIERPEISWKNPQGLDKILTGVEIAISPGTGSEKRAFVGLNSPPLPLDEQNGIQFSLVDTIGDHLEKNTSILYRNKPVGRVLESHLAPQGIRIDAVVFAPYRDLIRNDARFWRSGGVVVQADWQQGIRVEVPKPLALLSESIALDHVGIRSLDAPPPTEFTLFSARDQAMPTDSSPPENALLLTLAAEAPEGIRPGAPVYWRDVPVGRVLSLEPNTTHDQVLLHIMLSPAHRALGTSHLRFWRAKGLSVHAGWDGFSLETPTAQQWLEGGIHCDLTVEQNQPAALTDGTTLPLYDDRATAMESGIPVELILPTEAAELRAGADVRHRTVSIGKVTRVTIDPDTRERRANVLLKKEFADWANEGTVFWISRARVDARGIQNPSALLTGPWVECWPGDSTVRSATFPASPLPPWDHIQPQGKRIVLEARDAGSLREGARISWRRSEAGRVLDVRPEGNLFHIEAWISPMYAERVGTSTRFWNESGIEVTGGLGGIQVRTGSIESVLSGGIAFDDIALVDEVADGEPRPLYTSENSARESGTTITLITGDASGIRPGSTLLRHKGIVVGRVTETRLSPEKNGAWIDAILFPPHKHMASEGAIFWRVDAQIGLQGIREPDALLSGSSIGLVPGTGSPATSFPLHSKRPWAAAYVPGGLHIVLVAEKRSSLEKGAPVLYREMKVGEVVSVDLSPTGTRIEAHVMIDAPFVHLLRAESKFWNASGVEVNVGLFSGASVRSESLESLLRGGVAFATPDGPTQHPTSQHEFVLHSSPQPAWLKWQPNLSPARETISPAPVKSVDSSNHP